MPMVIIPAKINSVRVPNKNWRPFWKDMSLVEIKIRQALTAWAPNYIRLSVDEHASIAQEMAQKYHIDYHIRKPHNGKCMPEVTTCVINDTPIQPTEDVWWLDVTHPFFGEYAGARDARDKNRAGHDSLVVARPFRSYLLDLNGQPVNFSPSWWHPNTQDMTVMWSFDFECVCIQKWVALKHNYVLGKTPHIYPYTGLSMAIDTPDDFDCAKWLAEKVGFDL